jgi:hypothetical protein
MKMKSKVRTYEVLFIRGAVVRRIWIYLKLTEVTEFEKKVVGKLDILQKHEAEPVRHTISKS